MPESHQKAPPAGEGGLPGVFERLVEEHYQPAYRFAFSLCGNHNDACDLAQQAFFLAQTKGHQLRDRSKAKQWLFTILHREFLGMRRHATAHPQTSMEFSEPELPHITVDNAASIDAKTALAVLQTFDTNFKAPLVLFYLEQLSYKEIAESLEIPIGTVMSRLARGKAMLRERLERKRTEQSGKIVPLHPDTARARRDG